MISFIKGELPGAANAKAALTITAKEIATMAASSDSKYHRTRHWPLARKLAHYSANQPDERGCILWTGYVHSSGYGALQWHGESHKASHLAWVAVHGPVPNGMCVCHKCDVPRCVNINHLFLGTVAENMADKVAKGRHAKGARHMKAKLTDEQILAIREDNRRQHVIANEYGITQPLVSLIKARKIWRHI